jgi:hypothetical protein
MNSTKIFPLRLPRSLREEIGKVAEEDGISVNQFIAAAEKLAAMSTAKFFAERRARADFEAFRKILGRNGGEAPHEGDTLE